MLINYMYYSNEYISYIIPAPNPLPFLFLAFSFNFNKPSERNKKD